MNTTNLVAACVRLSICVSFIDDFGKLLASLILSNQLVANAGLQTWSLGKI